MTTPTDMAPEEIRRIAYDETIRLAVQDEHQARQWSRFWTVVLIILWTPVLLLLAISAIDHYWPYQADPAIKEEIHTHQQIVDTALEGLRQEYQRLKEERP